MCVVIVNIFTTLCLFSFFLLQQTCAVLSIFQTFNGILKDKPYAHYQHATVFGGSVGFAIWRLFSSSSI